MPRYDYRCQTCGRELELVHSMSDSVTSTPHARADSEEACSEGGPLERLISQVGLNKTVGAKPPSDGKLEKLGFTKYVKSGSGGYEKAFGGGPDIK